METDKEKRNQIVITAIMAILSALIAGVLFEGFSALTMIVFSAILIGALYGFYRIYPFASKEINGWYIKFRYRPKIRYWFRLLNENDLRLYIHNPKGAKEVDVICHFNNYTDIRGRSYLSELGYRHELKLAAESYGGNPPLYNAHLVSNDMREVIVGIPYNGKIALYLGDAPVYGFRDGRFEYILGCVVMRQGEPRSVISFRIWLIIKDGVLVKIQDEP